MANDVAALHFGALLDAVVKEVAVPRFEPETVVEDDQVSVAALETRVRHGAGGGGVDGLSALAGDVEPRVEVVIARKWIDPMSHRRREPSLSGPDRRRGGGEGVTPLDGAADDVEARL